MSIFDKLTDPRQYTGMYALRNAQAIDKTNPFVEKKGTGHARNFNEAPIEKYGLQADKPAKFRCWNGLDKHAEPQTIVTSNIRTMDQLISKCCVACKVNPQPTKLYTAGGRPIRSLDSISNNGTYVAIQKGARFNPDKLPMKLKEEQESTGSRFARRSLSITGSTSTRRSSSIPSTRSAARDSPRIFYR